LLHPDAGELNQMLGRTMTVRVVKIQPSARVPDRCIIASPQLRLTCHAREIPALRIPGRPRGQSQDTLAPALVIRRFPVPCPLANNYPVCTRIAFPFRRFPWLSSPLLETVAVTTPCKARSLLYHILFSLPSKLVSFPGARPRQKPSPRLHPHRLWPFAAPTAEQPLLHLPASRVRQP